MLLSKKTKKKVIKTPDQALQYLIDTLEGVANVARAFEVRHQTVCQWIESGRLPAQRVMRAYELCDQKITLNEFRPDVFPKGIIPPKASLHNKI